YYNTSPYDNPTGPTSGSYRVLRGGSWFSNARHCRLAYRISNYPPNSRTRLDGFRIVLGLE
ncbi:MAG: formylglycine-generating enzyme family protein, partial [Planctomycetota bacterium]